MALVIVMLTLCHVQCIALALLLYFTGRATSTPSDDKFDGEDEYKNQIEELRRECEAKENKALSQIAKSRKMVALLQSQLEDAKGKQAAEKERFESEISHLNEQLGKAQTLSDELDEERASLKEEKAALLEIIQQKEEELQQVKEDVRANAEVDSLLQYSTLKHELLHSPSPSQQLQQSPMQSMSTIPLRALEEVLDVQSDSQLLTSGSVDMERSNVFLSSLEQSVVSMDPAPVGSPLQSQLLSGGGSFVGVRPGQSSPPQYGLLAMSRLSHHSSSTAQVYRYM